MRRSSHFAFMILAGALWISCGSGTTTLQVITPTAVVTLSFSSLTFSGQVVGTTSPTQTVTVTNSGTAALTISSITTSGDFAATQTCGTTVAASANCPVSVAFTPRSGGPQAGSLIIQDNAAGSPHIVMLSGTGMSGLVKLSTDTFTNTDSQHATEVEPGTFAFGSTLVSAFQVGRFFDGGASGIGFATSTDGGTTWTNGFLPGLTKPQNAANPYDRASDPAVAYDARHAVWLIESLPILSTPTVTVPAVLVSRSTDAVNWGNPVTVSSGGDPDKPWITCDNWPLSKFFGNCYVEWDLPNSQDLIQMSVSSDGGLTWGPALSTADSAHGIGGQPVVQPNGTVVVPIAGALVSDMLAFSSNDGGASWSATTTVAPINDHTVAGNLRTEPLPSAAVDSTGLVYVLWQDCSFRINCSSNDIIMATSGDGVAWTAPARIPIDAATSTVDHFIPAIAVDPSTSGSSAHLAVVFYSYPVADCTAATCQLDAGFVSSHDGGATWSSATQLAGPMNLNSLPATNIGVMVGDYISVSYADGLARGTFAVANPAAGTIFDEAIYTTTQGFSALGAVERISSAGERPVPNARRDHALPRTPVRIR